ncbi:MAG: DedA family protein [Pirellulales bacterium]
MNAFLAWGYIGIIVFLILTGCGLPIPEEVAIVAAGCLAAPQKGVLDPWLALGSCFIGATVGDMIMYGIGRKFGRRLLQNHKYFSTILSPEKERHIEEMFTKHGMKVLLVSRFLIGIRSPIYITAGILKVPFKKFVLIDAFCAGLMIASFFALAYFYSDKVLGWIQGAEKAFTISLLLAAVAGLIGYRIYRKRKQRREAEERLAHGESEAEPEPAVEKSVA